MKLNCDLGEGLDDADARIMPHIDMANIACGGHAGNEDSMQRSVMLATKYEVAIGAHPSYPDKTSFGRSRPDISDTALSDTLYKQVESLNTVAKALNQELSYIKPHGALYHDILFNPNLFQLMSDIARHFEVPLVVQATPQRCSAPDNIVLILEAFADRAYADDGALVPRKYDHAVHKKIDQIVNQAESLTYEGNVFSENGKKLSIIADTLCVHSDSPHAVEAAIAIRQKLGLRHG